MARNDGVDRTSARNRDVEPDKVADAQAHNEREKSLANYSNQDIVPERIPLNVHYKAPTGSYEEMFSEMQAKKIISTRGLKADAVHFNELLFDVNTAYFHRHGGYEYAKKFYQEAYRAAVEIVGGEQYILSAVMHADERNRGLSKELGEDVYHYHLHVVYIPVVEKKVLWTKRCKDPELVGTVKEIITQVSSSKKWLSEQAVDENGKPLFTEAGKPVLHNSYSKLQDDFFNHMKAAGYDDIERGEQGSSEEHLTITQFKAAKEAERLEKLQETNAGLESSIEALQAQEEQESEKLDKTKAKIEKQKLDLEHIEQIDAKPALLSSKVTVEKSDFDALKTAAQKYVMQEKKESKLKKALEKARKMVEDLTAELKAVKAELAQHKSVLNKLNRIDLEQENAELKARIRWYDTIIDAKNLRELFSRYDHRRQKERQ